MSKSRRDVVDLESEVAMRQGQVAYLLSLVKNFQSQLKVKQDAPKEALITTLVALDSGLSREDLRQKSDSELQAIRPGLDAAYLEKTDAVNEAFKTQRTVALRPLLTVGAWDTDKKRWVVPCIDVSTFQSVAALKPGSKTSRAFTVGAWDPKKGEWVGGI